MPKTSILAFAAALSLFAAGAAHAQANSDQSSTGATMMMKKGAAPKSDAAGMKADSAADTSADASAAKPKAHHKMAKNEAAQNEAEAETTRQLNEQQSQYAQNAK